MVQQTARTSIWSVHRAYEAPRFRQKLSHGRRFHFGEVLATMNTSEMRQVACKVQLVSDYGESCCLLQIKLRSCHKISRSKEVLHPFADWCLRINKLFEVNWVPDCSHVKLGILQIFYQSRLCSEEKVIKLFR